MSEYTREEILKMIEEVGGPQNLELSGQDLSEIDLSKEAITQELEEYRKQHPGNTPVWLSETTEGINLSRANLQGARLRNANLSMADLLEANLAGASLWGVNLREAYLEHANLQGAALREANLSDASLTGADLRRANLYLADLQHAWMPGAILRRARAYYPGRPRWAGGQPRFVDLPIGRVWLVNFQEAVLTDADLDGAVFSEANFRGARLENATLLGAHISWGNFQDSNLVGSELQGAMLYGSNFQDATLIEANFEGANLEAANLRGTNLWAANLQGTRLVRAELGGVDLGLAKNLGRVYFAGVFLEHARLTTQQLGHGIGEEIDKEYYEAKEAYILLKNNFNQIGRYGDASWAYTKERQMEKMTYHPKLARTYYARTEGLPEETSPKSCAWWRFYVKYTLKWLWDWIIEGLCGYGERPLNVVAVASVVLIAIFPSLYFITGLALRSEKILRPWDYLLYSLYAFASMEHPTLQATSRIAQLFTGLDSLSGIALLALLMYTLGRRISRS